MTFVVMDNLRNVPLAILSDIGIAEWVSQFYLQLGIIPAIRMHEAVECVTVDADSDPIFVFEM